MLKYVRISVGLLCGIVKLAEVNFVEAGNSTYMCLNLGFYRCKNSEVCNDSNLEVCKD